MSLPKGVLQTSDCTHFFYEKVLRTALGMGMGTNVTAQDLVHQVEVPGAGREAIAWGTSRARILMFFCAAFARVGRLHESLQHSLANLQGGDKTVSANLRDSPRNFQNECAEKYQILAREMPYRSPARSSGWRRQRGAPGPRTGCLII